MPKEEYRWVYFEALDLAVTSIRARFGQTGFKTFLTVERLVLKAAKRKPFADELDEVFSFFGDYFYSADLAFKLATLLSTCMRLQQRTLHHHHPLRRLGLHCLLALLASEHSQERFAHCSKYSSFYQPPTRPLNCRLACIDASSHT